MSESTPTGRLDDEIERALLARRRLFFSDEVNSETVEQAIRKLWFMELKAPGEPITLVINSPGGNVKGFLSAWKAPPD